MKKLIAATLLLAFLLTGCAVSTSPSISPDADPPRQPQNSPEEEQTESVFPSWLGQLRAGMTEAGVEAVTGFPSEGGNWTVLGSESECSFLYNVAGELVGVTSFLTAEEQGDEALRETYTQLISNTEEEYGEPAESSPLYTRWASPERNAQSYSIDMSFIDHQSPFSIYIVISFNHANVVPMESIDPKGSLSELLLPPGLGWNATIRDYYSARGYIMPNREIVFSDPNDEYAAYTIPLVGAGLNAPETDLFSLFGVTARNEFLNFSHNPDYVQGAEYDPVADTRMVGVEYNFSFYEQEEKDAFFNRVLDEITELAGESVTDAHKQVWTVDLPDEAIRLVELFEMSSGEPAEDGSFTETYVVGLAIFTQNDIHVMAPAPVNETVIGTITAYESYELSVVEQGGDGTAVNYWCLPGVAITVLEEADGASIPLEDFSAYIAAHPDALYSIAIQDNAVMEIIEQQVP